MKSLFVATAAALACAASALAGSAGARAQGHASARPKKESPFACDRLALSPAERKRHFQELGPALRARKTGVRELADGYAFQFPADAATLQLLAEWSLGERRCCPFLDIELHLEREGGPLWLRMTGRKGTKEFIRADAGDWITSEASPGSAGKR